MKFGMVARVTMTTNKTNNMINLHGIKFNQQSYMRIGTII